MLLSRLITDLRDLSLAEAGQLKLTKKRVNIADLIAAEAASMDHRFREHEITFESNMPDDLPLIAIDGDRIRQVLHNLLINALQFTPAKGKITIEASVQSDAMLHINVTDTGSGISENRICLTFLSFF